MLMYIVEFLIDDKWVDSGHFVVADCFYHALELANSQVATWPEGTTDIRLKRKKDAVPNV